MIEIQNWRDQPDGVDKPILASFDCYLPKIFLILRQFKVIRKKAGGWYLKGPAFKERGRDGADLWTPYFSFSGDKDKAFFDKVYEMVKDNVKI